MSKLCFDIFDPSYLNQKPSKFRVKKRVTDFMTHYRVEVTGNREDIVSWVVAEFMCHRSMMEKHLSEITD